MKGKNSKVRFGFIQLPFILLFRTACMPVFIPPLLFASPRPGAFVYLTFASVNNLGNSHQLSTFSVSLSPYTPFNGRLRDSGVFVRSCVIEVFKGMVPGQGLTIISVVEVLQGLGKNEG